MPDIEVDERLIAIDNKLTAVVALLARLVTVTDPALGDPRHASLDSLLHGAGLSQAQIAAALGKDPSRVSRQLAKDRQGGNGNS